MMAQCVQATPQACDRAVHLLHAGALVAIPTETVYGLAGDATCDTACAAIYDVKNRPRLNPLIAHMCDHAMARAYVSFCAVAEKLAQAFWPGPLTLVLPRLPGTSLSKLSSAGLQTQAVRVPALDVTRTLIARVGRPLVAPSANPSGQLSPTSATHVVTGLGAKIPFILDAGPCQIGLESTIVKIEGDALVILRAGGITKEALAEIAPITTQKKHQRIEAPGMLAAHYAPQASLRLNALSPHPGEAYLGFGVHQAFVEHALNLSPDGDLTEAAANLFEALHRLDQQSERIAIAPIPKTGLGVAINDRLRRASLQTLTV